MMKTEIKTKPLGTSDAKIVYIEDSQNILSLPCEEVLDLFKSFGLLLFRGFGVTPEQMKTFSEQFSSRFVRDPHKQIVGSFDGFIQTTDNGMSSVSAHCENAVSPFRPDVVWFYCVVPAAQDGETLFWDGVKVWEELSETVKQVFLSKKLRFVLDFSVDDWKLFFGPSTTITDVKRSLDDFEEVNYIIRADQSICMEYTVSAVVKTKFNSKEAFANSILVEYERQHITFEDGSPIPEEVIESIKDVMSRFIGEIPWQAGDLVMIDNSRFLHGRRAFNDTQRQLFTCFSYLKS